MTFSGLLKWIRATFDAGGWRAPWLMVRYARLVILNRTSKNRLITSVPQRKEPRLPDIALSPRDEPDGDVVIPIYNNFTDTISLLAALDNDTSINGRIILVHDCSTDDRLSPALRGFAARRDHTTLLENERNLGFVETCNRGMAESTRDVVILNTDIGLPRGAVRRILNRLQSDSGIATVTPYSNLAYGVGIPELLYENTLPFGAQIEEIDRSLQSIASVAEIRLPAGVGFCMGMSRRALSALGGFDKNFGLGYGEETDFCLRADAIGMKNVLASDVFVAHHRGKSFGATWQEKSRKGTLKVLARHPNYVSGKLESYLQQGEARAVALAALVRLAEELSGEKTRIRDRVQSETDPPASAARYPELTIVEKPGCTSATLNYANESYRFQFSGRDLVSQTLALVPSAARSISENELSVEFYQVLTGFTGKPRRSPE